MSGKTEYQLEAVLDNNEFIKKYLDLCREKFFLKFPKLRGLPIVIDYTYYDKIPENCNQCLYELAIANLFINNILNKKNKRIIYKRYDKKILTIIQRKSENEWEIIKVSKFKTFRKK